MNTAFGAWQMILSVYLREKDCRTTLVIKNIPKKYRLTVLWAAVNEHNQANAAHYDMKDGDMVDYVQNSLLLNESELHRRQLKVGAKRTNIPRLNKFKARRPRPYGFCS